ncbi:hypothetical protein Cgig2_023253 [Carnegiea gigantea]|uniref:Uncharacterized protein n=1 Tax=Carnegiea gigantea TaxID=171969 RepID=A0A9Q1H0J4_9CARY|nr:hypothetical protein Cgig2_023253 [Carnegiea gigantea]
MEDVHKRGRGERKSTGLVRWSGVGGGGTHQKGAINSFFYQQLGVAFGGKGKLGKVDEGLRRRKSPSVGERNADRGVCSENNEDREHEWGFYWSRRVRKKRSEHNKGRKKKSSARWMGIKGVAACRMGWVFDLGYGDGEVQVATLAVDWEGHRRCWSSNGWERCSSKRRWEGEGDSYVCFVRGMLVESGDGKVTYEGGSRKCMVMREGMGAEELLKMMRKMTGSNISEEKLWYNLKYDREMLVVVEVDSDAGVIFKGNDKHGYIYLARNAGPVRREHARAAVCKARERDTEVGAHCNDVQEVGEQRGNNETGVKRSVGVEGGEQSGSRLRLGGDTIEMSDDDEIYVASEDAGDREAVEEDNAGDEGAAEKRCGDGSKREACDDGNDVNDNVHVCAGVRGVDRTGRGLMAYISVHIPSEGANLHWRLYYANNGFRGWCWRAGQRTFCSLAFTTNVACVSSNLWGTKNTFDESQKIHTPPTKPKGEVKPWFITVLRRISLALSSPTLISVTTITEALVITSSPVRFGMKDARAIPLQFYTATQMSVVANSGMRGEKPMRLLVATMFTVYAMPLPSSMGTDIMLI